MATSSSSNGRDSSTSNASKALCCWKENIHEDSKTFRRRSRSRRTGRTTTTATTATTTFPYMQRRIRPFRIWWLITFLTTPTFLFRPLDLVHSFSSSSSSSSWVISLGTPQIRQTSQQQEQSTVAATSGRCWRRRTTTTRGRKRRQSQFQSLMVDEDSSVSSERTKRTPTNIEKIVHRHDDDDDEEEEDEEEEDDDDDNEQYGMNINATITASQSYTDNEEKDVEYDFQQVTLDLKSFNLDLYTLARKDPSKAQTLLERMEGMYQMDPNNSSLVQPDSVSYTTVIEGLCKQQQQQQRYRAGNINNNFNHHHHPEPPPPPSSSSSSNTPRRRRVARIRTRDIDQAISTDNFDNGDSGMITGGGVNGVDVKQDSADNNDGDTTGMYAAVTAAQKLLDRMEALEHLHPSPLTYRLVCQGWARSPNVQNAQAILERYAQKAHVGCTANNTFLFPQSDLVTFYAIVIEGWCRLVGKVPDAMERAEALLNEMETSCCVREVQQQQRPSIADTNDSDLRNTRGARSQDLGPFSLAYTSIISALPRTKQANLARKADIILQRMARFGVEPDVVVYTCWANCWAKATSRIERKMASKKVLKLLDDMEDSYITQGNYLLKPSSITYATAIKAIGYSLDPDAPKLAEEVLRRMYRLTESKVIHVPPTIANFNAVITALSTSGTKKQKGENARRAEALLVEMIRRSRQGESAVEPSAMSWGSVLRAWAESGLPDSGEQAQRVLDQFEKWYEAGNSLVRPNVVCYTTVMSAWGRGNAPPKTALEKVNKILSKLEQEYIETLDETLRPNKVTYITAIDVYCRKMPDIAGSLSQSLVDRMIQLYSMNLGFDRPTRIVFNTLINAWSRSKEPNAAENAEKIFQWMEAQYLAGNKLVQPDEVSLCGVLNAWANNALNGGALRAQQIMDHTEILTAEQRGFNHTIVSWNVLIKAWGRSRAEDSVTRAKNILLRLEKQYEQGYSDVKPDTTTYSSVINCCAYYNGPGEGKGAAFEVAWRAFCKIKDSNNLVANNVVYGTLFKAIGKLTPHDDDREKMVRDLFAECCSNGQVCSFVLSQVRSSSPKRLFRKLVLKPSSLRDKDASNIEKIMKKMPKEWGRNAVF